MVSTKDILNPPSLWKIPPKRPVLLPFCTAPIRTHASTRHIVGKRPSIPQISVPGRTSEVWSSANPEAEEGFQGFQVHRELGNFGMRGSDTREVGVHRLCAPWFRNKAIASNLSANSPPPEWRWPVVISSVSRLVPDISASWYYRPTGSGMNPRAYNVGRPIRALKNKRKKEKVGGVPEGGSCRGSRYERPDRAIGVYTFLEIPRIFIYVCRWFFYLSCRHHRIEKVVGRRGSGI